jgi:lysozyme
VAQPVLKKGAKGEAVRTLQGALGCGVDGEFGPATEKALRAFQTAHGLECDGVCGPGTWAALQGRAGRRLSDAGLDFIARHEGFVDHLYNDAAGHATIGYGHLVHRGPITGSEPEKTITRERAVELLRTDARAKEAVVRAAVKVPLSQPQFDALVSFVFNVGEGNFRSSTLLRELNAGNYDAVPPQLGRWVHGRPDQVLPGLVTRRKEEGALFSRGAYH